MLLQHGANPDVKLSDGRSLLSVTQTANADTPMSAMLLRFLDAGGGGSRGDQPAAAREGNFAARQRLVRTTSNVKCVTALGKAPMP